MRLLLALCVFWGARDVYRMLSCDNCIVHALDLSTPLQLAKYLQYLLDNPNEYLKYFTSIIQICQQKALKLLIVPFSTEVKAKISNIIVYLHQCPIM